MADVVVGGLARWALWGRMAFAVAQVLLGVALMPGLADAVAEGFGGAWGQAFANLLAGSLVAGGFIWAGVATARRSPSLPHRPPSWAIAQVGLVGLLGCAAWVRLDATLGLLAWTAAFFGLWSLRAHASHRPDSARIAGLTALPAGLAYALADARGLLDGLLPGATRPVEHVAQTLGLVPGLLAVFLTVAAFLAAILSAGPARRVAILVAAVGLAVAAVQTGISGLTLLSTAPFALVSTLPVALAASLLLALAAVFAILVAVVLGSIWAVQVVLGEAPAIVERMGRGFSDPDPGDVCTACGWVPSRGYRYCAMCGAGLTA